MAEDNLHWLLNTVDAMVWAEEFDKLFQVVSREDSDPVDDGPGLMVGWFANAMAAQEIALQSRIGNEIEALGWLSAELASRSGAWDGKAPEWFPEPPEWLELWRKAKEATWPTSHVVSK